MSQQSFEVSRKNRVNDSMEMIDGIDKASGWPFCLKGIAPEQSYCGRAHVPIGTISIVSIRAATVFR